MSVVVLAMSGGVDSSVAAHLLLQAGHEVVGVFMRHGASSPAACDSAAAPEPAAAGPKLPVLRLDHQQGCCTAADAEDARRVSDRLEIPFYALDLNDEFGRVIDYFVDEYSSGRTPNPCVRCNQWIKFGKLFDYADSVGAEFVATGHYSRMAPRRGEPALLRGVDSGKDQSYALFGIERRRLTRMLLPVGGYRKPQIREIARTLGLNVAEKKDSQEICFVASGRYDAFVRRKRAPNRQGGGDRSGELVTTDGTVVGRHQGIEGFTVGQRKGLGVALGERKFVTRIEPETNRVVLGDREAMLRAALAASECNWLTDVPEGRPFRCHAQIRYNAVAAPAEAVLQGDMLSVTFDEPQFGVSPGQAVVCYDNDDPDRALGGGWIV